MKKIYCVLFFLVYILGFSQEDAWVYFKDKPNTEFYFENPLQVLSQRSLDRRSNQNIALDSKDVPIYQPYINQISASPGIMVKAKSKWLNAVHIRGSVSNIQNLQSLSFVDSIQFANRTLNVSGKRNNSAGANKVTIQNKNLEVATTFAYGNSSNQVEMVNAHLLHQSNNTGTGKIIAVFDSGFSAVNAITPFQRMFNNQFYLGGYNFVAGSTNVFSTHNHGTMTLSCMTGYVDGQLVGTAPDASYYLFITEDIFEENPVEESYWVEAAEMADSLGVDIISTSLGYFGYDNPNYSYTYQDMTGNTAFASKGANIAFSKGMIVVASAGNSGNSSTPNVGVPAEATNVLAVGAVKFDETYATFSSIGPSFDGRVKPDVMAKGQSTTISDTNGNIVTASGTSFSCPIIAGAIASFWQAIPWASNQQVVDLVKQSSDRFSNPNNQFGYGIPDFQLALNMAQLIVQENDIENFSVFPNPVKNTFSISFPNYTEIAQLLIYNNLGQKVLEKNIYSNDIVSLEGFSSGIYFYKIKTNLLLQSGKLIKN